MRKSRLSLILVSLAIVFSVGDAIHYTNSKKYIQHASIWAGDNLDDDKKIFTNSQFIRFYIGENNTNLTVDFNDHLSKNHRYDYLLIDTREKTPKLKNQMSKMELHELHVFGRKHQVLIYKIDHAL